MPSFVLHGFGLCYHIQNVHYQLFILVHNIIFDIDPRIELSRLQNVRRTTLLAE